MRPIKNPNIAIQIRGFTLIEILVVMVILVTIASTIQLTLPDNQRQEQNQALEKWQEQIKFALALSQYRGGRYALQIDYHQLQIIEEIQGGDWETLEDDNDNAKPIPLPEGMSATQLKIQGQPKQMRARLLVRKGRVAPFNIIFAADKRSWQLRVNPDGQSELTRMHNNIYATEQTARNSAQSEAKEQLLRAAVQRALQ